MYLCDVRKIEGFRAWRAMMSKLAKRMCVATLSAFFLSACETTDGGYTLLGVPPPPATPIRDRLIVPGYRVGPVALGITLSDLYRELGEPDREARNLKIHVTGYIWKSAGLNVGVSDHMQRVVVVAITNDAARGQYALRNGVSTGSSGLEVRTALGPPAHERVHDNGVEVDCYSQGLEVELHDGVVFGFTVTEPIC
jgi:hypothetical protein